jgi:hypothetical protein
MWWRKALMPAVTLGVLGLAAGTVLADPTVAGTYKLSSRKQGNAFGARTEVRLWVEDTGNGSVRITRQEVYSDGRGTVLNGTGTASSSGWIRVDFKPVAGLANSPVFNQPTSSASARGTYTVDAQGKIRGYYRGPDRSGTIVSRYEAGQRTTSEPVPGGSGNTGGGGTTEPAPATGLADLGAQVVRVSVLTDIAIKDVGDTQFEQALGAPAPTVQEPAAILKDSKLRLRVFIAGKKNPSQPITARLTGTAGGKTLFSQDVQISSITGAKDFTVVSSENLSPKVAINALSVAWKLNDVAIGTTPLRVYTTFKAPVKNIAQDRSEPATKVHFENACRWANGASKNIGQGPDSLGHQLDNQMRHYVHWQDLGNQTPAVPDYPRGSEAPKNYKDLGWVSNGTRGISSLYYPPLEPTKEYQQYHNFRNNFGWWLLDNPTHTGGRCNQQASLVCSIVGTVGIKGRVLYLERTGTGRRTGRPVRNYFYASGGGGPWNFHGVALIDMDDGSQWIYDGSFSSPPNRKNGTREWAENAGGPFLDRWANWYYEDMGGIVPADDVPTTWQGIQ